MTASAVLNALPQDASAALATAGGFAQDKVVVRFRPFGALPPLPRDVRKITATQKFETVVSFLRKALKLEPHESLFLYVNSSFAPALDEVVGNLHRVGRPSLSVPLPGSRPFMESLRGRSITNGRSTVLQGQ